MLIETNKATVYPWLKSMIILLPVCSLQTENSLIFNKSLLSELGSWSSSLKDQTFD